ncbi:PNPOx family protein [Mycolicibacterium brisbanense]|nr:nitroreductase [Mycolicibacterium brisbanense]MCV7155953.1 nitroreductase [Mycolicibacterium brisbanense]
MSTDMQAPFRDAVRRFNKHVLNPAMLHLAGRKHWYASVIRHTGRVSGRQYATPVVAEKAVDGYIIPLPYGTRVDWLRNVLAAGRATITSGGETREVTEPSIVDLAQVAPQLSRRRRRTFERLGIAKAVKVKTPQKISS